MSTRAPSEAQRAARRAFVAKYAPETDLDGLGPTYVEPDLVGRQLYHRQLGIIIEYQWSAVSRIDGQTVRGGRVCRRAGWSGVALGSDWGTWAERLRIIIPKETTNG